MRDTLESWILEEAKGEPIVAVVVGGRPDADGFFLSGYEHNAPACVLSWEDAVQYLRTEFDSGYGGTGCPPVYAWTPTRIIYVREYDGATGIKSHPRNPEFCEPHYS